jgi:phytoene dehydrogenase-like protein
MKKLIIIGAGIAGLTCGVYAQLNGFDTEIYEKHSIPGGECTGWDRKGYHFDGCLHWLVGSKPATPLNKIWRDTGALDDSVRIHNFDVFMHYVSGDGASVRFYTDADKLEKHLCDVAPEDKAVIRELCAAFRGDRSKMMQFGPLSIGELVAGFKNPVLRSAIVSAFPEDYMAMSFVTTMAGMNAGDCGFPHGGSRALAKRMESKYQALGGRVFYNAEVDRILADNGKAVGIRLADGREAGADFVVSCADGYDTLKRLLDDRYTPPTYDNLFDHPAKYPTITSALVFLGVDADIPFECKTVVTRRDARDAACGIVSDNVMIVDYGFDGSMAPAGKSVFSCYYRADYDAWKAVSGDREAYLAEKKKLEAEAVTEVTRCYPGVAGKIEVTDVVTPLTYERYCNAWRGSWMTWVKLDRDVPRSFPGVLPGLENFLMAGMWTIPPGGLPGAAAAGRAAVHTLCGLDGIEFKG